MSLAITILGCGSSGGVPRLGQGWGACDPANPKNRRRRCSILLEQSDANGAKTTVLVDMGPDLRDQLLGVDVDHLDAILLTHPHADHVHGIDDVRPLVIHERRKIDVYMDAETSGVVRHHFNYIFETPEGSYYPPLLNDRRLEPGKPLSLEGAGGDIGVLPFRLDHGEIPSLGFRFGNIAYTPDLNGIPEESRGCLEGLDIWIVDALRYTPHPSHFSVPETLAWIERLKPKRAILTNLHYDLDFGRLKSEMPAHIEPAFDGMQIIA
ncbi:MAG TPA: MBL fold metallo-hydrolase [Methylovirgula sp.]|jgi:phosphoribosyl 1,2-cyclic phosphate phosphodiesterase|nr:MBL fold metallo-hydrolase [Methylovirgula sp.]